MKTNKLLAVVVLAAAIGAPIAGFIGDTKGQSTTPTGVRVPFLHGFPIGPSASQAELASLTHADEWLNSPPLMPEALRGKVVLVNFWTYTCINWRRQLPYVRAWQEKYKDQGLVVIGVHAPEFEFEKNIDNIRWAVNDMKIDYPVAVDNNHAIWRAFRNQAWPALYFIDAQGRLRHQIFGEGSYEQSEMVIQSLLREAGTTGISREPVNGECSRPRRRRRLGQPQVSGKLCRVRAHRKFCLVRRRVAGQAPHVSAARAAEPE